MIARSFPASDHKGKDSRWEVYYRSLSMDAYLATLEYDEVTGFLEEQTRDLPRDAAILDLGCGSGRHLVHLAALGFSNLLGLDLVPQGIRNLQARLPGARGVVGDGTRLPLPAACLDLVVMVGIVYEIPAPGLHQAVFAEIARVLRPGGRLIFINNSPYNLGERLFTLTDGLKRLFCREPRRFFVWRYQRADVRQKLAASGLRLKVERGVNVPRGVYRFLYGVFVRRQSKENRRRRLDASHGQPYSLHEYYLVQKDLGLLNPPGRLLVGLARRHFPFVFANSICHAIEKPKAA